MELEVSTGSLSGSTILTCNAINFSFSTLEWFMNDTVIAKYSIDSKDQYPVTVPADPFVVKLMDVIITGGLFNFINFTLITDVCNLLEFEGQSISCGTMQERSNSYNISLGKVIHLCKLLLNYLDTIACMCILIRVYVMHIQYN